MATTRNLKRGGPLAPDPEMWAALDDGKGLRSILERFYARVYVDALLSPFFRHITQEWVVEKQYSFLYSILTGERVYFGQRPRNAHHYMVISDALFDYREELFGSCLREHGLPEPLVARFRAIHEVFRRQIVKDAPRPRKIDGLEVPLEGYDSLEMSVAGLCDVCVGEIGIGEIATFHVRTGRTYCDQCAPLED